MEAFKSQYYVFRNASSLGNRSLSLVENHVASEIDRMKEGANLRFPGLKK
jgi:hypothetical protein